MSKCERKVYLAGAIASYPEGHVWRDVAMRQLPEGWTAINPLHHLPANGSPKELVITDLELIDSADAVILNADRPSWGSAMEIRHANLMDILVIAWNLPDDPSPWLLAHVGIKHKTLNEAIEELRWNSLFTTS